MGNSRIEVAVYRTAMFKRAINKDGKTVHLDNDRVQGNSWSGKSALSEEQRRQLRELERSGAANASFEDTTYVEFLG